MVVNGSDDYLWDRTGPPDDDVRRLEELLGGFAHDRRFPAFVAPRRWRRWPWFVGLTAVAAAAAVVLMVTLRGDGGGRAVRLVADGRALAAGETFVATGGDRDLVLGDSVAWLTLREGSQLRVHTLTEAATLLALDQGHLQALVSLEARPGFFQVDTPASRCVDHGCMYDLEVTPAGDAHVVVTLGRVAFQDNGREVYVPSGAECYAARARGAGTPRWIDSPAPLVTALDAFDAAIAGHKVDRLALARDVLALTLEEREALVVWHLLQDVEADVARAAVATLERLVGRPDGLEAAPGAVPTAADRELWKEHLGWW